jgi:hypothetical protein
MAVTTTKSTAPAVEVAASAPRKVTLELAFYTTYTRKDSIFRKGIPYSFSEDQAEVLLEEVDPSQGDRPIWRRYRAKAVEVQRQIEAAVLKPVDMTSDDTIKPLPSGDTAGESATTDRNRVEIGSDAELAELIGNDPDAAGTAV